MKPRSKPKSKQQTEKMLIKQAKANVFLQKMYQGMNMWKITKDPYNLITKCFGNCNHMLDQHIGYQGLTHAIPKVKEPTTRSLEWKIPIS